MFSVGQVLYIISFLVFRVAFYQSGNSWRVSYLRTIFPARFLISLIATVVFNLYLIYKLLVLPGFSCDFRHVLDRLYNADSSI